MAAKYDLIGKKYNTTRRADPYLFSRMLALLQPTLEGNYLDIGCGTGNYTKEFGKKGFLFTGIDPSKEMLRKAQETSNSVKWNLGSAEHLGVEDASFNGAIATLTLHHWSDLGTGFASISQALTPKARFVIFTATPKQMEGYWLTHYFPKMMKDSAQQMANVSKLEKCLSQNSFSIMGMETYTIQPTLKDFFLYSGKHEPEKYLDEQVRSGISSFSHVAHQDEVRLGVRQLKDDLKTGAFSQICQQYENKSGDYLFLVANKK